MNERLWTYHGYSWSQGSYMIRRGENPYTYLITFGEEVIGWTETLQEAIEACDAHAEDQ